MCIKIYAHEWQPQGVVKRSFGDGGGRELVPRLRHLPKATIPKSYGLETAIHSRDQRRDLVVKQLITRYGQGIVSPINSVD